MKILKSIGIATIVLSIWGCSNDVKKEQEETASTENLPLVVATTSILCDLTQQVAQDTVNLKCLVAPGVDPHVYQATPEDRQAIESADLVLYGGYNFDSSLIKLIKATTQDNLKIAVHEEAVTNPILAEEHDHGHSHDDHDHDHNSEEKVPDPHVWHNPENGAKMVAVIAEGLTQVQPKLAEKYSIQSQGIQEELGQIDEWIRQQIATIPPNQRKLVTTHDALGYYVEGYNLEFRGALSGISTDESPSAGNVANLVKEIKETQVPTIFAETSVNPQLIETVAREANVKLSPQELYADSLGEKGTEGDSYQKMLIANTRAIVEGLGGQYTPFNSRN